MLPARDRARSDALVAVEARRGRGKDVRLRAILADGTIAEGVLIAATRDHVTIRERHDGIVTLPAARILALSLARPRRSREWALAGVGILAAVEVLVGLVSLPGVGAYLRTDGQLAFRVVYYCGAAVLVTLLAKTRLRDWLTRWETVFDEHEA